MKTAMEPTYRRSLMVTAALGAMAFALPASAQTITVWSGYPELAPFYEHVAESMKADFPDLVVQVEAIPIREHERRIALGLTSGSAGALVLELSGATAQRYIENQLIPPAPENVAAFVADPANFNSFFVDYASYDGTIYGVPLYRGQGALFYNTEMFEAAGLSGPPTTMAEYTDYAEKLTQRDANGNPTVSGWSMRLSGGGQGIAEKFWINMFQYGESLVEQAADGKWRASFANDAGLAALPLLYWLGLRWTGSRFAAGLGVTLYALSRVLMFPCVVARPDMLCGCFGFGALAMAERWHTDRRKRWLVASGALIGGGFLTHPFALVYALQIGLWVCLVSAPMSRRIGRGALLTATSLVVFSLWGILIAQKPELFKRQFFNNVVGQAGPGLPSRVIHPWPAVRAQAVLFGDHAGSIQGGLMVAGLVGLGTILLWRRIISDASPAVLRDGSEAGTGGRDGLFRLWLLGVSSVYFLVICQGQHPTKGYLCYPGGLMFLCLGATVGKFADGLLGRIAGARREGSSANVAGPRVPWLSGVVAALLVAAMLPGSGLRATAVYLRHWNDIDYDAPRFTAALIDRTPANARLIVDPGYIFDFYRSGRDVRLGLIYGFFYDVRGTPYDYVIGGPYSIRDGVPEAVGAEFVEERGDRSDLFACHARIYRAPGAP